MSTIWIIAPTLREGWRVAEERVGRFSRKTTLGEGRTVDGEAIRIVYHPDHLHGRMFAPGDDVIWSRECGISWEHYDEMSAQVGMMRALAGPITPRRSAIAPLPPPTIARSDGQIVPRDSEDVDDGPIETILFSPTSEVITRTFEMEMDIDKIDRETFKILTGYAIEDFARPPGDDKLTLQFNWDPESLKTTDLEKMHLRAKRRFDGV